MICLVLSLLGEGVFADSGIDSSRASKLWCFGAPVSILNWVFGSRTSIMTTRSCN